MQRSLACDPPVDRLAQIYFMGNKWWAPPDLSEDATQAEDEAGGWDCPFPDVTE
jgi:hypothetical protein